MTTRQIDEDGSTLFNLLSDYDHPLVILRQADVNGGQLVIPILAADGMDDRRYLDFFHSEWDCDGRKVQGSEVPSDEALGFLDANDCILYRFDVMCTKHGQVDGETAKPDDAFGFLDSNGCLADIDTAASAERT